MPKLRVQPRLSQAELRRHFLHVAVSEVLYFEAEMKTVEQEYGPDAKKICARELACWTKRRDGLERTLTNG